MLLGRSCLLLKAFCSKCIAKANMQSTKDKQEIDELTRRSDDLTLQIRMRQEHIAELQARKESFKVGEEETNTKDEIARCSKLLAEAHEHWKQAKEICDSDQKIIKDLEDKRDGEQATRNANDARVRELEELIPVREQQEVQYKQ